MELNALQYIHILFFTIKTPLRCGWLTDNHIFSKTLTNLKTINNLNAKHLPLSIKRHILFFHINSSFVLLLRGMKLTVLSDFMSSFLIIIFKEYETMISEVFIQHYYSKNSISVLKQLA